MHRKLTLVKSSFQLRNIIIEKMGTRAEIRHPPKRNPKTQTTAQRKSTQIGVDVQATCKYKTH